MPAAEIDLGSRAPCHGLVEPKSKAFSRKKGLGSMFEEVSVKLANRYYKNLALNSIHSYDISFWESGVLLAEIWAT